MIKESRIEEIKNKINWITNEIKKMEDELKSFAFIDCSFQEISFGKDQHGNRRIMYKDKPLIECKVEVRLSQYSSLSGLKNTAIVCAETALQAFEET